MTDATYKRSLVYDVLAALMIASKVALGRPAFVGLCGPQGSGKSTMAHCLQANLRDQGTHSAVLSLDDFYLTRAERKSLADRVHPLLSTRGPPGTHDVRLAEDTTAGLLSGASLHLPSFDKACDDRVAREQWKFFRGPADVVIFEGWCLGACPAPSHALREPMNELESVEDPSGVWRNYTNTALNTYQELFGRLDILIFLAAPSFDVVVKWRDEQEQPLRERVKSDAPAAMSAPAVARFVQHFERVTRALLIDLPARADAVLQLGPRRECKSIRIKLAG